jgi:hypothetical protein
MPRIRERVALAFAAACCLAQAGLARPAEAAGQQVVVLTSQSPYWKVGVKDDTLSRACSLGRFNLRRPEAYVARFRGKDGAATLGVAKGSGLNLYDPDRRAKPIEDYFFLDHGTTSCRVFVGGRNSAPPPKAP